MFIGFDRHATSEHLLSAVIERLCEVGHSVHIIQKDTGGDLPAIPEKLSRYNVTTDAIQYQTADKRDFIARYLTELKYINACKKFITSDYDAVFIQSNNLAGFAVKAIRRKLPKAIVTYNVQDIFPYNAVFSGSVKKNCMVFKVLAWAQRYGYRHSDHVITISEDMKDTLVADGTDANKIEIIYNWSYQDEPYENTDVTPVEYMFDKAYFNVVYAGNIGLMQNVDIIIESAELMKEDSDIWFHIIGSGVHKEKLELRAREYGITNISFWPMQPVEKAPALYACADVNIIPLANNIYRTALPSKTATCMAVHTPIVFCIGKESQFAQRVKQETNCPVADCSDSRELYTLIKKIKNKEISCSTEEFFIQNMGITKNSMRYAEIIESERI